MKKFISFKVLLLIIIPIFSTTLLSCRQDDENDSQRHEASMITDKTINKPESDNNRDIEETDPPIKNGTHWLY